MNFRGLFNIGNKIVALFLVLSFLAEVSNTTLLNVLLLWPNEAEAAQVTIEATPNTTAAVHTQSGASTVFIDDQVGYKFHRYGAAPSSGMCGYRKTTNGGGTWGSFVVVDTQTDCIGITVWYDKWTPGDTGTNIHISTIDTGDDDVFYNRLDTTSDTLLLVTAVNVSAGSAAVYAAGTNENSITKGTDGRIYIVADDGNATVIRSCISSCNLAVNWGAVGTPPQGNADSWSILMPLSAGNILLINRSTGSQVRSSTWNGSIWSGFTIVDASAIRNTTYDVGMAATIDTDTGDIYIAYTADNDTFTVADHDIRTRLYSSGSWSSTADIITNHPTRGLLQVAIGRDQNNGNIYVAYTARTTIGTAATANVYYRSSTDSMTSWGAEQGPLNSAAGDFYGVDMNIMSYDRLFTSWYNNVGTQDIFGDTNADIGPEIRLTTLGTQTAQTRTDANAFYVGGAFMLESLSSQTVSNIVITESGTVQAQNNIKNVELFYEFDTSAPYNCVSESYTGGEAQFGSTVSGGFSGANGVAGFTNAPVSILPTQSMCIYPVFDVEVTAGDGDTIEISVADPETDITVSGGFLVYPDTDVALAGTTTIVDPNLTQFGYHWRTDNGTEVTASSATLGVPNTPLNSLSIGVPRRIRVGVANQGSTSTLASTYQLEYGLAAPACTDTSSWEAVGAVDADFVLSNSANLTDGNNTTNIASSSGGITDLPGTTFLASNGGVRDTTNTTGSVTLAIDAFIEAEFSIVASTSATEGQTYCFRMTRSGTPLSVYSHYPEATIAADVSVQSFGTQTATADVLEANVYAGGGFAVIENATTRDVTSVEISELGTVDGATDIENVRLVYEFDTTLPYNCSSVSYGGTELQYGATSTNGFDGVGETAVFTDTVSISSISALCLYVVYDVSNAAQNGETIDLEITSPADDVLVSGGASVGPSSAVTISGETTVQGPIVTQLGYHWRTDNGTEVTASSATAGTENTPLTEFAQNEEIRLRLGITNTGSVSSVPTRFRVEYAPKITTCDMATVWTDVNASLDGWDMYNSAFLTNGETTTNISIANGGVSNGSGSFIAANGGVRDTESLTSTTTIPIGDYLDVEFSLTSTSFTSFGTTYCFRASSNGTAFNTYSQYAEVTTAAKRDFKVQRGSVQVSGTSATVTAGVDYVAPASSTRAFVRITNSHQTGAGNNVATAGQNADDVTAYISNPSNISTSFTITRPPAATSNTRVDWEIVEFIGNAGTDNEMVVRGVGTLAFNTTAVVATGTVLSNVSDNSNVVVFVTGSSNRNTARNFYASQVTSEWNTALQAPIIRRAANGASAIDVSYAVVEFVGPNWNVQRVSHTYSASGVTETEPITAVNSLARTFIHAQRRVGATTNVVNFGDQVWLSSIGAVSFQLESGATVAVEQTSVAWVIENIESGGGAMVVQRSNGLTTGGTAPLALSVVLSTPIEALNNTSISANSSGAGANTTYPRPMAGFTITSTTTYQIWRSNTGTALQYRVELVEWPVADLSIRQNYYRFYADNNALTPTDPWPPGPSNLGENTSITIADEPLGTSDVVRIRMTLRTANATMPAGLLNYKLQYATRVSTCSAVDGGSWSDVGDASSGTVWRGFSATGTADGTALSNDPPTGGELLISIANRAGVLVHESPSAVNPYPVNDGDDVEYDWYLQHNGATPQSTYCFRAVYSDGSPLDTYSNYPQIRTAGFSPATQNWRWYNDSENETPLTALANEDVAPINIVNGNAIALRINVNERRNVQGEDIKFKLQFSEDVAFTNPIDVAATTTCTDLSLWCYEDAVVTDNQIVSTKVLTGGDVCVAGVGIGCGRHNTGPNAATGHVHFAETTQEYSFTIRHAAARVNAVYYFRLYDVTNNSPVTYAASYSYPSLVTEGPVLELSLSGLPSGTSTAGVITDVSTTPSGIGFGTIALNTEYIAAHRITVETNATEGYQLFKFARQQLQSANGVSIPAVAGTNLVPGSWIATCNASSTGCFGYHASDPTLKNGSTRFAPADTYAGLQTTPAEVMYSSIPTTDTHDIVYRIRVNELQPAGLYETEVVYLAVPSY